MMNSAPIWVCIGVLDFERQVFEKSTQPALLEFLGFVEGFGENYELQNGSFCGNSIHSKTINTRSCMIRATGERINMAVVLKRVMYQGIRAFWEWANKEIIAKRVQIAVPWRVKPYDNMCQPGYMENKWRISCSTNAVGEIWRSGGDRVGKSWFSWDWSRI